MTKIIKIASMIASGVIMFFAGLSLVGAPFVPMVGFILLAGGVMVVIGVIFVEASKC